MTTVINDLFADGVEVIYGKDNEKYYVDVKYVKETGKFEDGEYLAGFTDLTTEDDAEFLARAFVAGYKLKDSM